jgi:deoxycytidine triphosphate deaminase
MPLSYVELVHLVKTGAIDADLSNINGASIDICLGSDILYEDMTIGIGADGERMPPRIVDLSDKKGSVSWVPKTLTPEEGYVMAPGEIILAHSIECFRVPLNIACDFKLRSSGARNCLDAALAGWVNPGFGLESDEDTRLTLELQNISRNHGLLLRPGLVIGQMVFFHCVPVPRDKSYVVNGRYNGTSTVQASRSLSRDADSANGVDESEAETDHAAW